jgi:hypothetical protein
LVMNRYCLPKSPHENFTSHLFSGLPRSRPLISPFGLPSAGLVRIAPPECLTLRAALQPTAQSPVCVVPRQPRWHVFQSQVSDLKFPLHTFTFSGLESQIPLFPFTPHLSRFDTLHTLCIFSIRMPLYPSCIAQLHRETRRIVRPVIHGG